MVREIVKDTEELSKKCTMVRDHKNKLIKELIRDMLDTASYHAEDEEKGCVGLAANQVGAQVRVILCLLQKPDGTPVWTSMINPVITNHSKETYESEEGCLSLDGTRTVKRYTAIEVMYKTTMGRMITQRLSGLQAAIVQHEIDHLNGKLI